MKIKISRFIKRKFKNDVFNNLIREDIEKHGKVIHSINSAYIGIDWALKQNEDIKRLIENNNYDKGFQDAIKKAKQIIISFMPLPSHKNHNLNYEVGMLEERQKYAHKIAEKFEEMMNADEKGIC